MGSMPLERMVDARDSVQREASVGGALAELERKVNGATIGLGSVSRAVKI